MLLKVTSGMDNPVPTEYQTLSFIEHAINYPGSCKLVSVIHSKPEITIKSIHLGSL